MTRMDTVFTNANCPGLGLTDITVREGRIAALAPAGGPGADGAETVNLDGLLTVPGFVEGHIHLDFSFWGDSWVPHRACTNGFDVGERVRFQSENIAQAAPLEQRARTLLELALAHGSTTLRSHVMIDAEIGLSWLMPILALREGYRDLVDIQLVAFPQSGILKSPGTAALMDEAVGLGVDLVGGLDPSSFDRDSKGHLDAVFDIADRRGAGVDIHLHEAGPLGAYDIEEIIARTEALGLQGRVAISHAYGLGDLPPDQARRIGARLARAGVAIMTNAPGAHAFPPVALLRAEGVTVFAGSDNIRDSWWPYGDGDMLGRAMMIGYRSGFYMDEELTAAFDIVTAGGAKALGLGPYGLVPGARADFVALPAAHVPEAVVSVPKERRVFKRGRLVAEHGRVIR